MPLIARTDLDLVAPYLRLWEVPDDTRDVVHAAFLRLLRAPDEPAPVVIDRQGGEPRAIALARQHGQVTVADLLACGAYANRASAESALARLARGCRLRRLSPGVYALPLAVASGG
jgi:hypothetical protein